MNGNSQRRKLGRLQTDRFQALNSRKLPRAEIVHASSEFGLDPCTTPFVFPIASVPLIALTIPLIGACDIANKDSDNKLVQVDRAPESKGWGTLKYIERTHQEIICHSEG